MHGSRVSGSARRFGPAGTCENGNDQLRKRLPIRLSITYPYAEDVAPLLPAGTVIHITTWHDNTDNNPHNPNPKNWVGYGQRTIDEMSFAWVSLYYLDQKDYEARVAARHAAKSAE